MRQLIVKAMLYGMLGAGLAVVGSGCTPVAVGSGAAGGYAVATDERSTGRQMDDAGITTRIKAEMVQDATVKARDIDVDTVSGEVYLAGFVDSPKERQRAEAIARSVPGVTAVHNDLQIGSRSAGQALDDKNLGIRIKSKLIAEPGIRSLSVDVDVYRGVVHLTGLVESAAQKTKILDLARSVPGTVRIVDNLQVKGH